MSIERFTTVINDIKFHFETFHINKDIWYNTLLFYQNETIHFDLYTDQDGNWQVKEYLEVPGQIRAMKDLLTQEIEIHNSLKWKNDFFHTATTHPVKGHLEMSYGEM